MANVKISGLPAASAVADANEFEINEAGTSKKVTGSQIAAYVDAELNPLTSTDIGTTVQAYDADTAKYDDVTANFTGTLQNGSSNVLVDTDIGSTVQAYNANNALTSDIANATYVAGANGTSGQLLQSDGDGTMSWTDVAGGGAWSVISKTTFSGDASYIVDFSSYTSYDAFKMILSHVVPSSDNVALDMYFGQNGASFDTARADAYLNISNTGNVTGGDTSTHEIATAVGSAAGERGVSGEIFVSGNITDTSNRAHAISNIIFASTSSGAVRFRLGLHRTETVDEDSIQLSFSSGNLESGTITLLGLNQS